MDAARGRRRRHRSKKTSLFTVLSDHVSEHSHVKEFLLHRMGKPSDVDFEVVKVKKLDGKSEGCSLVEICFTSYNKAGRARYLLNKSNRNTNSKVLSYFKECEAVGVEVKSTKKNESEAVKVAREIVETAQRVVGKHDEKISAMMQDLKQTEGELTKKRGVSLDEFEMLSNEKLAREDKLKELELQRREFGNYVQSMKKKILALHTRKKFDAEIREVRKAFGVECAKLEHALPIYSRREDILNTVEDNQVSIILGETGSGKSTQMVQYLYQAGFAEKGLIACTQPRKIAATSLATHVSSEMASRVGQEIGYQVGMQSKKTAVTKVLFMTDHVLLNECLRDNNLSAYSCIIIDEAHERSIFTDLLIGMLKDCMKNRPELRVVITSATIDPDIFVSYFGGPQKCPVLRVSGRTFPVEVFWENDQYFDSVFPDNYERKALNAAIQIHREAKVGDGDILVFLTSQVEIERCCESFQHQFDQNCICLPLHGKLKAEEQQLVFAPNPPGKRKVVFATNSAETSITIPGIKFVVDSGVVKEMRYDPKRNMNSLDVVPVSQSSANQRKGRAGRTAPGICYRLYTEADYNKMNKTGCPEILRIHLGQAMLKLMELKVNPLTFEFVESPSVDAMTTAFQTLKEVGAVSENAKITELGQWISKLPVEPRLGAMIKHGIDAEVPVEVLIIAASCSQGGIFYRAGGKEEKKQADLKKVCFCHPGGDLLTVLNVYREWDKVNEKGKGGWCKANYINGKSMKGARDMVKEILMILQKECSLKIKYELKKEGQVDEVVQKLLFKSYKSNVSFYLGHEKAGYITTKKLQHVQIHPSSCLHTLALQPNWVVFCQLLKTTDNFITNITPVSEEDIDAALKDKLVDIDKESLKKRQVECVLQLSVGKHVFWKFVGPMHQNRREIENNIRAICNETVVVIEADKLRGEISLYCVEEFKQDASEMLQDAIRPLSASLLLESKEEPIGHDQSNVRALLRKGCGVIDILMPHQYRSINIQQKDFYRYELTEENVQDLFSAYGPVEQVWRPFGKKQANSVYWGKVTFLDEADAIQAVEEITEDADCDFTVIPIKHNSQGLRSQEFTIRLSWCRRPGKGICYVYLERPEDLALLVGAEVQIGSSDCAKVMASRAKSDLMIRNLNPLVTEEDVKEALAGVLGVTIARNSARFKVIIPRVDVQYFSNEMERVTRELSTEISSFVDSKSFKVNVKDYKEKTAYCVAFVKFQDAQKCSTVATGLDQSSIVIGGNAVEVAMEFKASVVIPKRIYDLTRRDIESFVSNRNVKGSSTKVQLRVLKSGNTAADIGASSPLKLAKVKLALDTIIEGDTLEIGGPLENLQVLFTSGAKQKKQQFEKASGAIISINDRTMKVTIQGLRENRLHAFHLIEDYIAKAGRSVERSIALKGESNPPGLMKAVLTRYGSNLGKLQTSFDLLSAHLHLHDHVVTIVGDEDAVVKAEKKIHSERESLLKAGNKSVECDVPDCPVCLCAVEFSDYQRLEYCGHAYCRICLISMIENAIKSRKFPLQCAADGCGKNFVIRDISTQLKMGKIKKKEFLESAVSCFIAEHNKEYKFCITPDCDMIYKVSTNGTAFRCFLCQTDICTTCHIPFHDGLSCEMYKSAKREQNTLKAWLREKPNKRKLCPNCEIGIEKIEGCDHMQCLACKAHICWKCLKYFSTGRDCYGHLDRAHGSFV